MPKLHCRVIGIAEDAYLKSIAGPPDQVIYAFTDQLMGNILVRGASSSVAIHAIHNAVHTIDSARLTSDVAYLQTRMAEDLSITSLLALFVGLCGFITTLIMWQRRFLLSIVR